MPERALQTAIVLAHYLASGTALVLIACEKHVSAPDASCRSCLRERVLEEDLAERIRAR